jgi:hypothetical protein
MTAACVDHLNDWLRAWENKRINNRGEKREREDRLRENRKAWGRYFSGKLTGKIKSIKRMEANNRKTTSERKTYDQVCKRRKNRQKLQT